MIEEIICQQLGKLISYIYVLLIEKKSEYPTVHEKPCEQNVGNKRKVSLLPYVLCLSGF